jgi:hypothetical protein
MMKKSKKPLLAAMFALMATLPAQAQDSTITNVMDAARALDPIETSLSAGSNPEQASADLLELQQSLQIFGEGPEMTVTFLHKGATYTVPIDFDAGTLRFSRRDLFSVEPTSRIIEPAHSAIMRGITDMSATQARTEKRLSDEARAAFIPLSHPDAAGYINHLGSTHDFNVEDFWETYIVPELEKAVTAKSTEFRDLALQR